MKILLWIVILLICLLSIPIYLNQSVIDEPAYKHYPNLYTKNSTEIVYFVISITFERWETGFSIFVLLFPPVIILIVFSVLLILNVRHARQLCERFRHSSVSSSASILKCELRITTTLVIITLFTVLVELSRWLSGIVAIIGNDNDFFSLHSYLITIWEITSTGTSFRTFIIYCLMSQEFRMEMYKLILLKCFRKNFNLKTNNHLLTDGTSL